MDLDGSGWIWVDLGGSGWIWVDLSGSEWICEKQLEKHVKSEIDLDYSWEVCEIVKNSSQKARSVDTWSKKGVKRLGFLIHGRPD